MKDENLFSLMFGLNFRVSQEALFPSLPPTRYPSPTKSHIQKLPKQQWTFSMGYSRSYNVRIQEMNHMIKPTLYCEDGTHSTPSVQRVTSTAGKKDSFKNNLEQELSLWSV